MVAGQPVATEVVPSTQVFTPPQVLLTAPQVFTPPQRTVTPQFTPPRTVIRTTTPTRFLPPRAPRRGRLPFTGIEVPLGLVAGFALLGSGALLLARRRREEQALAALEHQAAKLRPAA